LTGSEPSSEHRAQSSRQVSAPRFPRAILASGVLALLVAGASAWLIAKSSGAEIHCDSLAPLTVLATLAAFLISVCFRQMGRYPDRRSRWVLFAWVLVAGATLFADFRFVRHYRGFCDEIQQQLHRPANP
jgi:FtsH-binding integral membrane protein